MISVNDLSPGELAALLHFHAEAGVEWLLEDEAVDRFAEFEAMKAARRSCRPCPAGRREPAAGVPPLSRKRSNADAPLPLTGPSKDRSLQFRMAKRSSRHVLPPKAPGR